MIMRHNKWWWKCMCNFEKKVYFSSDFFFKFFSSLPWHSCHMRHERLHTPLPSILSAICQWSTDSKRRELVPPALWVVLDYPQNQMKDLQDSRQHVPKQDTQVFPLLQVPVKIIKDIRSICVCITFMHEDAHFVNLYQAEETLEISLPRWVMDFIAKSFKFSNESFLKY